MDPIDDRVTRIRTLLAASQPPTDELGRIIAMCRPAAQRYLRSAVVMIYAMLALKLLIIYDAAGGIGHMNAWARAHDEFFFARAAGAGACLALLWEMFRWGLTTTWATLKAGLKIR